MTLLSFSYAFVLICKKILYQTVLVHILFKLQLQFYNTFKNRFSQRKLSKYHCCVKRLTKRSMLRKAKHCRVQSPQGSFSSIWASFLKHMYLASLRRLSSLHICMWHKLFVPPIQIVQANIKRFWFGCTQGWLRSKQIRAI